MKKAMALVAAVATLALSGCGSATSTGYCCLNKQYYGCPDANAAQTCSTSCTRDASKDSTCS
jgi:uncharacterized lipoprotein YmbA